MSAFTDLPANVPAASNTAAPFRAGRPGLWRDLACTAGSFGVILALLFGLAPGQAGTGEAPRVHPAVAALAD